MNRARAVLLSAAAGLALAAPARAQDTEIGRPYRVHDYGEARRYADEYARHVTKGEWELAARALQRLLDLPHERGVVLPVPGSRNTRYIGAASHARRLFEEMVPPARAAWEQAYGEQAEQTLQRGFRLRRENDLRQAARRFPTREIRRHAHEGLASLALARGAFSEAAFELSRLLEVTDDEADRSQVFARLAFARAQSGDREGTDRVRELSLDLRETPVPGPEGPEPLGAFLERMARAAGPQRAASSAWPQFTGNRHGTATAPPAPPPRSRARWAVPTLYEEGDETDSDRPFRWVVREDQAHRPVFPVVSQGAVFLNNGLSVRALDLSSGTSLWSFLAPQRSPHWRDNKLYAHSAAVTDGVVYVPLATRADAPAMERSFYGRTIVYSMPHRSMYALDARTGDVIWSHDDASLRDRPDAAQILEESVASPPLVVGDDVLVATWAFGSFYDVRLVCFDRRTGATRWRRSIAQGQQELNLFGRPVKELATTALAERDGRVFFGTGLGVAAGVDLADGEVAWVSAYPQVPIPSSNYWYQTRERPVTWWPSTVSATRRGVLMAPSDSPRLIAFDPADGTIEWLVSHSRRGYDFDYFLGVADGRAFVLGTGLEAIDVATGQRAWRDEGAGRLISPKGEKLTAVGQGVLSDDRIFVPTGSFLLEFDARTGRAGKAWRLPESGSREPSGNLVSADGALLVVNRNDVQAHYRFEDLRDRLLARISDSPDDPRLRLEAGEIFRSAGQLDDAVSSLEQGLVHLDRLAPRARERLETPLRRALHATLLERAAKARRVGDVPKALADLRSAVSVTADPGQAVDALFKIAEMAPPAGAQRALDEILREHPDAHFERASGGRVHAGALAMYLLGEQSAAAGEDRRAVDTWLDLLERHGDRDLERTDVRTAVRVRLERLATTAGPVVRERVHERAKRAFDQARRAGDVDALDRVARLYPDPEVRSSASILAARLHMNRGRPRPAVGLLRGLLAGGPDRTTLVRALWLLSQAYGQLGESAAERVTLQRVLREADGGERLDDGSLARESAEKSLARPEMKMPTASLPEFDVPLALRWEKRDDTVPQVVEIDGTLPADLAGCLLTTRSGVLECVEGGTGAPRWRAPIRLERRHAAGTRDTIVLAGDERGRGGPAVLVEAFESATGAPAWSLRLPGAYRAASSGLGVLYLLHMERDADGTVTHTLSAVELASGKTLAARDFQGQLHPEVTVAEDAVVVFESPRRSGAVARTVTTLDGATLALRGTAALEEPSFNNATIHPPESSVVITTDASDVLVAVDVATGRRVWRTELPGADAKALLPVPGAVIVSDVGGSVHRVSAQTGEIDWSRDLRHIGELGWNGEAAADEVVVLTVIPNKREGHVLSLALDSASGAQLWRSRIELKGSAHPHPVICARFVAYEVNERFRRGEYRSRVLLLGRGDGEEKAVVEHPEVGRRYQRVIYLGRMLALTVPGILAVYGEDGTGK